MTAPEGPAAAPDVVQAVRAVAALARDAGRDDLARSISAAAVRCSRPTTIVSVVGEFKQGKSSLVNSLIGSDLCPVDDDMATSVITLVHYGDSSSVTVRRTEDGEPKVESIDPATIRDWVTEAGQPRQRPEGRAHRHRGPEPVPRRGRGDRRHPGRRRHRDGLCRRDPCLPAVRRRDDLRQRRLGRAERARGGVPRAGPRALPDRHQRAHEDRPVPRVATDRRPGSRARRQGRHRRADGPALGGPARRRARDARCGPDPAQRLSGADRRAAGRRDRSGEAERRRARHRRIDRRPRPARGDSPRGARGHRGPIAARRHPRPLGGGARAAGPPQGPGVEVEHARRRSDVRPLERGELPVQRLDARRDARDGRVHRGPQDARATGTRPPPACRSASPRR